MIQQGEEKGLFTFYWEQMEGNQSSLPMKKYSEQLAVKDDPQQNGWKQGAKENNKPAQKVKIPHLNHLYLEQKKQKFSLGDSVIIVNAEKRNNYFYQKCLDRVKSKSGLDIFEQKKARNSGQYVSGKELKLNTIKVPSISTELGKDEAKKQKRRKQKEKNEKTDYNLPLINERFSLDHKKSNIKSIELVKQLKEKQERRQNLKKELKKLRASREKIEKLRERKMIDLINRYDK